MARLNPPYQPCLRSIGPLLAAAWLLCAPFQAAAGAAPAPDRQVRFNRDIRPILADNCFQCHGPDQNQRKAGLRLDREQGAVADLGGRRAIVPGQPEASELIRRVTATDPEERMPPASTGKTLSPRQIELLRQWIAAGAPWEPHWSFVPPQRPALPQVGNPSWVRNPIDAFVLARLEQEGLTPSEEADRATLIRRVSLDLTGLPPTPEEVDAFEVDPSPDAYEKLVDRLLASPRYGERMASRWLDAARYADTNGYQTDGERHMWRWRDWVIDAYNLNLPFDQFTIEQLAGDLLPRPTLEQQIATGFNRNHRGNSEGGIIPEEYAVEYVCDRVETTATVWLALTLNCARCHDHKFDPFTQQDYYSLFAFFNNVPEKGRAVKYGNSPPFIPAPTKEQQQQLAQLDAHLEEAAARLAALEPELASAQAQWEARLPAEPQADYTITRGQAGYWPLDGAQHEAAGAWHGTPGSVAGRFGQAVELDGHTWFDAGDVANFGFYDKFSISFWIRPGANSRGTIVSRMTDAPQADGYYVVLENGKVQVNLVKRWLDDACRVQTARPLVPDRWQHVLVTYDGSRVAAGIAIYIDGEPAPIEVLLDELNQSFAVKEPLRIGGGGGPEGRFAGSLDEVRIYAAVLEQQEARCLSVAEPLSALASLPAERRTPAQQTKLREAFLALGAPAHLRDAAEQVNHLRRQRTLLVESFPTCMVMQELPQPRQAYILIRGQYDKPGRPVEPATPAAFPPPPQPPRNRLDLARWLVDPANPLTARVAVNRLWQLLFGTGLVKTVDDFGIQGEWPSHPELLDWLATEYVRLGWDTKAMLRLIVTSATYRQRSHAHAALLARDPENRLLARGPRVRLSAEMIRDQALAASGLLVERLGGPSVKPYQPEGLWSELADTEYVQDHGENLYRRSLYTFWKRTITPPAMAAFDAAGRESCTVRETRTNTPLQALVLLNEITFVEAARVLAQRVLAECGPDPRDRATRTFRLVLARKPREQELTVLVRFVSRQLERFRAAPEDAKALISVGEAPRPETLDACELAAYTTLANLVFNLDEAITKE